MSLNLDDSNFFYNGINLFIVKTNNFVQRSVYTDDGTDYLYTEFTIDINCIYNPGATSYNNDVPPVFTSGVNPSATNNSIRFYLLQPQRELVFGGGTYTIASSPESDFAIDANNGPQPISCDVFQLGVDKTWHVHYVIKTWIVDCPNGDVSPMISNRWSQSAYINSQRLLIRKTVGQAYFRTDILDFTGTFADIFRNQVIAAFPPMPGLYREEVKWITTTKGNALHYEITDIERMYNLGNTLINNTYVTKVDGYFSQSTMSDDEHAGAAIGCSIMEMKVQLWGGYEANNWTLCQLAIMVINQQIPLNDIGPAGKLIIRQVSLVQSIVDHYVEVVMAVQSPSTGKDIVGGIPYNTKYLKLIEPVNNEFDPVRLGSNPGLPNDFGSRGSDQVYLRSALLKDACTPQPIPIPNQSSSITGDQPEQGQPPTVIIYENDILPPVQSEYKPSDQPYNRAKTESQYQYNSGSIQAPIANPNDPSGSGSGATDITGPYPCEVLNFCTPFSTLHVDWWVERIGIPPDIPHFIKSIQCLSGDHQYVLQRALVHPYSTSLSNDLVNWIFSISGSYDYITPYSPDPTNPPMIIFDVPQNIDANYGDSAILGDQSANCGAAIQSANYIHGIIDTASSGDQGQEQGDN